MQPLRILAAIFFLAAIGTCAGAIALHSDLQHHYSSMLISNNQCNFPAADGGIVLGLCIVSAACDICSTWIAVVLFKSNAK